MHQFRTTTPGVEQSYWDSATPNLFDSTPLQFIVHFGGLQQIVAEPFTKTNQTKHFIIKPSVINSKLQKTDSFDQTNDKPIDLTNIRW